MDLIHDGGPESGFVVALRLMLGLLFAGGLPVALLGIGLSSWSRRNGREWQPAWKPVFQAGFVFQICSLAIALPVTVIGLLLAAFDLAWVLLAALSFPLASVVCGAWALRSWIQLRDRVLVERPPRVTP